MEGLTPTTPLAILNKTEYIDWPERTAASAIREATGPDSQLTELRRVLFFGRQ